MILAGSGMCTGGRVRHHLKHNLGRPESSVVFVGYAARGSLTRQILDGANRVHMFGEEIPVRAAVHTVGGFSAHADQGEPLEWCRLMRPPETAFRVHGEEESMRAFSKRLSQARVVMPKLHEAFEL